MTVHSPIVVLSPAELDALIRSTVREELAAHRLEPCTPGLEILSVSEAADLLRCSARSVRRMLSTGRLRASKLASGGSSRLLIARAEVERLLRESTT